MVGAEQAFLAIPGAVPPEAVANVVVALLPSVVDQEGAVGPHGVSFVSGLGGCSRSRPGN